MSTLDLAQLSILMERLETQIIKMEERQREQAMLVGQADANVTQNEKQLISLIEKLDSLDKKLDKTISAIGKQNTEIIQLKSRMSESEKKIDALFLDIRNHKDDHREQEKIQAARNWQLWILIIGALMSGLAGWFFALLGGV